MPRSALSFITKITLVLLSTIVLSGCFGPRLEVLSEKLDETSVKTDGQDDYAVSYKVRVRNKGEAGKVRMMAQLYHPEGTFYREVIADFSEKEESVITFMFTEPTVLGSALAGANGETKMRVLFRYESVD